MINDKWIIRQQRIATAYSYFSKHATGTHALILYFVMLPHFWISAFRVTPTTKFNAKTYPSIKHLNKKPYEEMFPICEKYIILATEIGAEVQGLSTVNTYSKPKLFIELHSFVNKSKGYTLEIEHIDGCDV